MLHRRLIYDQSGTGNKEIMFTVYIETTIPSYLTANPGRDLIVAAHQEITREWWEKSAQRFDLVISEAVMEEISQGDPVAAKKREELVSSLSILEVTEEVQKLADIYSKELGLPPKAAVDIIHIAFAVVYEVDYLLTWNCKHIANGDVIKRLYTVNNKMNRFTPVILTPEELIEIPGQEG